MDNVDPILLEAAARDSWEALIAKGDPLRSWQMIAKSENLKRTIDIHRKHVESLIVHDFNVEKSVAAATVYKLRDFPDNSRKFQMNLAEYLKTWLRERR